MNNPDTANVMIPSALQTELQDIVRLISQARARALSRVNEELIRLYWELGKRLSERLATVAFGEAYVEGLAKAIAKAFPGIKGYNRRGLYRMRQFYELYRDDEICVNAVDTNLVVSASVAYERMSDARRAPFLHEAHH